MKTFVGSIAAMYASRGLSPARLLTITLTSGTIFRFTDLDIPLTFQSHVFVPSYVSFSAVRNTLNTGVSNVTVSIMLGDSGITEDMIRHGQLDNAAFIYQVIDWSNIDGNSDIKLTGTFGDVKWKEKSNCDIDLLGISAKGSINIGETFSQSCRNDFGDLQCRYNVEGTRTLFTVTTIDVTNGIFLATALVETGRDNFWQYGVVTFTSGDNTGFSIEVSNSLANGTIYLAVPAAYPIIAGVTGTIVRGCSKERSQCFSDYNNCANFRGEPDVPTTAQQITQLDTSTSALASTGQTGNATFSISKTTAAS